MALYHNLRIILGSFSTNHNNSSDGKVPEAFRQRARRTKNTLNNDSPRAKSGASADAETASRPKRCHEANRPKKA